MQFTVDTELPDSPCEQLVVWAPVVQDKDEFIMFHVLCSLPFLVVSRFIFLRFTKSLNKMLNTRIANQNGIINCDNIFPARLPKSSNLLLPGDIDMSQDQPCHHKIRSLRFPETFSV